MDMNASSGQAAGGGKVVALKPAGSAATTLRYHAEIAAIEGCALSVLNSAAFTPSSYRIVHKDHNPLDFVPHAIRHPWILKQHGPEGCCKAWSLSMYETLDQLKAAVQFGTTHARKLMKKAGDHAARMELTTSDGYRSTATPNGHFSFYECDKFQPETAIKERVPLVP
jgi:hypothetical protein